MVKFCEVCGIEFNGKPKQKCCSRKCSSHLRKSPKIKVNCDNCEKLLEISNHEYKRSVRHYCNKECRYEHQKETLKGENNPNFKNKTIDCRCSYCGNSISRYKWDKLTTKSFYCSQICKSLHQKETLKGENNPNFKSVKCECKNCNKDLYKTDYHINSRKNVFCSRECLWDYMKENNKGENNPNYDETLSQEHRIQHRITDDYSEWRKRVYEKYDYTCQCCNKKGYDIVAHHLDGYNWCIEKRTNIDNGVVLCKDCHIKFHSTYGYGNNTKEQFNEFISHANIEISQEIKAS